MTVTSTWGWSQASTVISPKDLSTRIRPPGAKFTRWVLATCTCLNSSARMAGAAKLARAAKNTAIRLCGMLEQLTARLTDHADVAACQLLNPAGFAALNGVLMNQVAADSQSVRSGENEIGRRLLIDSAGSDHRHLRERSFQRPDVTKASHRRARKNLHEIGTSFPCGDRLGRRARAGENYDRSLQTKIDDIRIEPRAGNK